MKFDVIIKYIDLLCPNEYNTKYSKFLESDKEYHYKTIHKKHML